MMEEIRLEIMNDLLKTKTKLGRWGKYVPWHQGTREKQNLFKIDRQIERITFLPLT